MFQRDWKFYLLSSPNDQNNHFRFQRSPDKIYSEEKGRWRRNYGYSCALINRTPAVRNYGVVVNCFSEFLIFCKIWCRTWIYGSFQQLKNNCPYLFIDILGGAEKSFNLFSTFFSPYFASDLFTTFYYTVSSFFWYNLLLWVIRFKFKTTSIHHF